MILFISSEAAGTREAAALALQEPRHGAHQLQSHVSSKLPVPESLLPGRRQEVQLQGLWAEGIPS